jgi:hypothetical protein
MRRSVRDAADRLLQDLEPAFLHRQPVEEDDVQNDPADREQADHGAVNRGADGDARRHGEDEDGDQDRHDQSDEGGDIGLHLAPRDEPEQHQHRNRRDDG